MKRFVTIISLLITLFAASTTVYAADYYKLTKKVYANGTVKTFDGSEGIFVWRGSVATASTNKHCYDCTNTGRRQGNGILTLIGSRTNYEEYEGNCYYGNPARYRFIDDKGLLNIEDGLGTIWVFHRATAPAGKVDCSFLASNAVPGGYTMEEIQEQVTPVPTVDNNNTTTDSKWRTRTNTTRKTQHNCPYCHGTGVIVVNKGGTSGYGVNNSKAKCSICSQYYYRTESHQHNCTNCTNGKI